MLRRDLLVIAVLCSSIVGMVAGLLSVLWISSSSGSTSTQAHVRLCKAMSRTDKREKKVQWMCCHRYYLGRRALGSALGTKTLGGRGLHSHP